MRRFTDGVLTRINSCRFVFIRGFHCIVTAQSLSQHRVFWKFCRNTPFPTQLPQSVSTKIDDKVGYESFGTRSSYFPTAVRCSRVLNSIVPSEIAGVAMQVSPSELVAMTENFPSAGTT